MFFSCIQPTTLGPLCMPKFERSFQNIRAVVSQYPTLIACIYVYTLCILSDTLCSELVLLKQVGLGFAQTQEQWRKMENGQSGWKTFPKSR